MPDIIWRLLIHNEWLLLVLMSFLITFSDGIWRHWCCPVVIMQYNGMSVITEVQETGFTNIKLCHFRATYLNCYHKPENSNKDETIFHIQTQPVLKLHNKCTVKSANLALSVPAMSAQLTYYCIISLLRHQSMIILVNVQHYTQYCKLTEYKLFIFQHNIFKTLLSAWYEIFTMALMQ
jgi:hypothetical protein